jgi:hypothetical protein
VLSLGLLACGSAAIAADCENLLVPDFTLASADTTADLAYLALVSPANFERHKANSYPKQDGRGPFAAPHMSAVTALPIATDALHTSATYADFELKRERAYTQHQFHYSLVELEGFFARLLPQRNFETYSRCVGNTGVEARFARADHDFIELVLDARAAPGAHADARISQVSVNGADPHAPAPASLGNPVTLLYIRNLNKDFRFSAAIGGAPLAVFAPRSLVSVSDKTAAPAHCASAGKVAQALYHQILDRKAEPAELAQLVSRLENGTNDVRQLAERTLLGSEYAKKFVQGKSDEDVLRGLYRHVLARDADAGGLNANVRKLRGVDAAHMAIDYFRSYEYTHQFGEWTVPGMAPLIRYCPAK